MKTNVSPYKSNCGVSLNSYTFGYGSPLPVRGFAPRWVLRLAIRWFPRICTDVWIFSHDGKRVLIGRRGQQPAFDFDWVPGGGLRFGQSILESAARHVFRDIKLQIDISRIAFAGQYMDLHFEDSDMYELWLLEFFPFLATWLESLARRYQSLYQTWLRRLPTHTPVLPHFLILTKEEEKDISSRMHGDELNNMRWVSIEDFCPGNFDAYMVANVQRMAPMVQSLLLARA